MVVHVILLEELFVKHGKYVTYLYQSNHVLTHYDSTWMNAILSGEPRHHFHSAIFTTASPTHMILLFNK